MDFVAPNTMHQILIDWVGEDVADGLRLFFFIVVGIGGVYYFFKGIADHRDEARKMSAENSEDFVQYYQQQGVPEEVINNLLKTLRTLFFEDFHPDRQHSFIEHYGWEGSITDQYNTMPMLVAGRTLQRLGGISITEDDWHAFEERKGTIDTYDALMDYLLTKYTAGQKVENKWFQYWEMN